ncbi:MAG: HDIG domain-containing protein [Bacillota bacterium]|nr:HDIG domain-containing protein [Bacillota bacterium]
MEFRTKHPTKEECMYFLRVYNTPPHVIRHCIAVTDAALKIARALNEHGYNLDMELIQAAGLLHDISRVKDKHWEVGARLVRNWGYIEEADIIKVHMTYSRYSPVERLNETDMVVIGDRIVKEDKYVGVDARMQYIIEKAKAQGHDDAVIAILKKRDDMKQLMNQIEEIIGISIDDLMKQETPEV